MLSRRRVPLVSQYRLPRCRRLLHSGRSLAAAAAAVHGALPKSSLSTLERPLFSQPTIRQLLQSCNDPGSPKTTAETTNQTVHGWIRTQRRSKTVAFLEVSDGSTNKGLQCVVPLSVDDIPPPEDLERATVGASVCVQGPMVASQGQEQAWEMQVHSLQVLGDSPSGTYPLQKKRHSLEFLRQHAHLRHRTRLFAAVTEIRSRSLLAVHEFFQQHQFTHIHVPLLTSLDCEGGGEVFQVQPKTSPLQEPPSEIIHEESLFFQQPAYLSVSGQLHLEMAVHGLSRVYTVSPCFRADIGSETSTRHLAEFTMAEAEWAWVTSVEQLANVTEQLVRHVVQRVLDSCPAELQLLERHHLEEAKHHAGKTREDQEVSLTKRLQAFLDPATPWPRLSYEESLAVLRAAKKPFRSGRVPDWGHGLQAEHERYLCKVVGDGKRPVFVTDYPEQCKAFYMRRNLTSEHGNTVACFDLLVPGLGELVGGSLREERLEVLEEKLRGLGDDQEAKVLDWYRELRQYGSAPHGGFGLGFDRLLMFCTGMENIRDVVQCGRWKTQCRY